MISTKELRIGNLVSDIFERQISGSGERQANDVSKFTSKNVWTSNANGECRFKCNDILPVIITEYWLVKLGFDRESENKHIVYRIESEIGSFYLRDSYENGFYFGFDEYNEIDNQNSIFYIHQLQNLFFAITGEELTL